VANSPLSQTWKTSKYHLKNRITRDGQQKNLWWAKYKCSIESKLIIILIAKHVCDIITQTNPDKQNGMVEDLKPFQARKQVFLKQFLK